MSDFLSRLSGERVTVVRTLLPLTLQALRTPVKAAYDAEMQLLKVSHHYDPDPEAADAYITAFIERDLLLAFRGYCDWLAALLWRRALGSLEPPARDLTLPKLTSTQAETLANRLDASPEMFCWLESHLSTSNSVALPGIGVVRRGTLMVDQQALGQWASCFDWTDHERATNR